MTTLSFAGHAKGGVERVAVEIQQLVIALPNGNGAYRSEPTARVLQDDQIEDEARPLIAHAVLVGAVDRLWVTAGADLGIRKVVAGTAWRFEEVEPHWSRLVLGGLPLSNMRAPREVIAAWKGSKRLPVGVAMFCDGVPSLEIELADPVLGRTIRHSYYARRQPIAP